MILCHRTPYCGENELMPHYQIYVVFTGLIPAQGLDCDENHEGNQQF